MIPIIVLGFPEDSLSILQAGVRIATALDDKKSLNRFYSNMGLYYSTTGRQTEGRKYSGKAFEEASFLQPLALAWSGLGLAETVLADPGEGRRHVEKGLKLHRDAHIESHTSVHIFSLSICHYHSWNFDKAIDLMKEACGLSEKNQEMHYTGKSAIWLGRMLGNADSQKEDEAIEYIQRGSKILDALQTKPDVSIAHLFLGELYWKQGRVDKASRFLKEAAEMFEEMGMDYWFNKTQAILEKLSE